MSRLLKFTFVFVTVVSVSACASTGLVSSWKAPDAQPLTGEGRKVACVVMAKNEAARRAAEDALARQITRRGGEGVPMYTILPGVAEPNEAQAKAALEKGGFNAVVVLRPVGSDKEISATSTMYAGPYYRPYWGGYYGYGWGTPWGGGVDVRTNTIVTVETLVYSMKQNKLVWAGQSKTTNPTKVDSFVREIATAVAKEMKKQGLI
jgi:hypothetical protein